MPIVNGTFAYDQIISSMKSVAAAKNLTVPANFTLIDITYVPILDIFIHSFSLQVLIDVQAYSGIHKFSSLG